MVGFIVVFVVVRVNCQRLPLKTVLVGGGDTNVAITMSAYLNKSWRGVLPNISPPFL